MTETDLQLSSGTTLLHVGPHKTGTTAIQDALHRSRTAMAGHGVVYPGRARQHAMAARAVTRITGPAGNAPASMSSWYELVGQVRRAWATGTTRAVVVSSESFVAADDATARTIVDQLGPRVHVVVTLRPLGKILPSAWQQYVRETLPTPYRRWLRRMLKDPPYSRPTPSFWRRHSHDALVDKWASIVGPENVTVVVVDDSDRFMLVRTFERLLGLPQGLLVRREASNTSLTYGEIELVRHLNIEFERRGWTDEFHRVHIQQGLIRHLQRSGRPTPDDQRITTPRWALVRAAEIGAEAAAKIALSGVRVVGDLSVLGAAPPEGPRPAPEPSLPSAAAMEAVIGTLLAARARAAPKAPTSPRQARSVLVRVAARLRREAARVTARTGRRR